eukprot:TRINITY_DN967_c0_g1_i3.p1 TRINITY_DN967_c0_g1~~TRINITY_DN967_c0_g1_i3.p1  ORF type:complete len:842 (+),score=133.85 TRINITY_DN967_c0_g1_i3:117-2642(+)
MLSRMLAPARPLLHAYRNRCGSMLRMPHPPISFVHSRGLSTDPMADVLAQIARVEEEIRTVQADIKGATGRKEELLMEEKNKLRDRQNKLQDEKNILLQQDGTQDPITSLCPDEITAADLSTVTKVIQFFEASLPADTVLPDQLMITPDECPQLRVPIPCVLRDGTKIPDMLLLDLPEHFPHTRRAAQISSLLRQGKTVFAPAVSGAGKTRTAYDMARETDMNYFDFNGGHAKVKQQDVVLFHDKCDEAAAALASMTSPIEHHRAVAFDRPIRALFVSRLIMMHFMRSQSQEWSHWKWLLLQINTPHLCHSLFQACFKLSKELSEQVCTTLLADQPDVFVTIDEGQALMRHWWWYPSRQQPPDDIAISPSPRVNERRPLGKRVLEVLRTQLGLSSIYVGATDLGVKSFESWSTGTGGIEDNNHHHFSFDFLGGPEPLPQMNDKNFPTVWEDGVGTLLRHIFKTNSDLEELALSDVGHSFVGRPRFGASFTGLVVNELLYGAEHDGFACLLRSVHNQYVFSQLHGDHPWTIRSHWQRVIQDEAHETVRHGDGGAVTAWTLGKPVLLQSVLSRASKKLRTVSITCNPDLVSRGVALLSPAGDSQFIVEPLVMSAGLTYCAQNDIDLCKVLEAKLKEPWTDAQYYGKLMELLIALRLFQQPNRLHQSNIGLDDSPPAAHEYRDIQLGGPLTEVFPIGDRPSIHLLESHALLDVCAPPFNIAIKTTQGKAISADETRNNIHTSDISHCYAIKDKTKNEWKEPPAGSAFALRRAQVLKAVQGKQMIRVRVELPEAAPSQRPKICVSTVPVERADGVEEQLVYVSTTIGRQAYDALGLPADKSPQPT